MECNDVAFVLVQEALRNTATTTWTESSCICNAVAVVAFALRYRLCVEESHAIGIMGKHGRGACEAAGLEPEQVEVICASMGTALASVGGFCVGHHEVRTELSWIGVVELAEGHVYATVLRSSE